MTTNLHFSRLPCDILLMFMDWTQDPSRFTLVDKRLNRVANLWFENQCKVIVAHFPHYRKYQVSDKSVINFRLLYQHLQTWGKLYFDISFPTIPTDQMLSWACKNYRRILSEILKAQAHRFEYSFNGLCRTVSMHCFNAQPASMIQPELSFLLRKWKKLHDVHFRSLTTLNLTGSHFFVIPDLITHIASLTKLEISQTKVHRLHPCLGKLRRLRELRLEGNEFLQYPALYAFRNLTALQVIDCPSMVNLKRISRLTRLSELILVRSTQGCPDFLTRCTNLRALRISDPTKNLWPTLIKLDFLPCLILGQSLDEELPLQITQMSSLFHLGLENHSWINLEALNSLTQLSTLGITATVRQSPLLSLKRLTNLTYLRLETTRLYEFPSDLTALTQLQTLRLCGNFVSRMPNQLSVLTRLTRLDLSNNEIEDFPAGIQHFSSLTELNLNSNNITIVPTFLASLTALRNLSLAGNRIIRIPAQVRRRANLQIELGTQQENTCQLM